MVRRSVLLEICVDSPNAFSAAVAGGADRIELCACLALGGLTPSPGMLNFAARSPCPSRAMIRPRVGSFIYTPDELDVMRGDIDAVRAAGLAGIVIGANLRSGALDADALAALVRHADGLELALHRAIDLTPDPLDALDLAIALGFDTILTSGGHKTAREGADIIAALVERARGRIEILAGGGVTPDSVGALIERTAVRAVHASCSAPLQDAEPRALSFGFIAADARETDRQAVERLVGALPCGV